MEHWEQMDKSLLRGCTSIYEEYMDCILVFAIRVPGVSEN